MTARPVDAEPDPAPQRVPGLASTAIHGLLKAPGTGMVLGTSGYAVWLLVHDSVIVVSTADATRLPNGIEIAADSSADPFASVHHGETVEIGFDRVMLADLAITVARWWDPRPVLSPTTTSQLEDVMTDLPAEIAGIEAAPLREALENASTTGILTAARGLLGRGAGLTPEGDDYLAGALAALRTIGPVIGSRHAESMLDAVGVPLARLAEARTTTFSAALIQHALRGQVAAPAGDLLRALAGRGDTRKSHQALIKVGHSSGPALAAGIVLGAQSLIHLQRRDQ